MVSHDIFTIRQLCDRVLWLHEGEVRRQGPTAEVLDEYHDFLIGLAGKGARQVLALHGDKLYREPRGEDSPLEIDLIRQNTWTTSSKWPKN